MTVMMLLALWSGSDRIEALVACSLLSMVVGLAERARPGKGFFAFIVLPGLIFALTGSRFRSSLPAVPRFCICLRGSPFC